MTATATVKGGFWPENGVSSLTSISGKGFFKRRVAMLLGRKQALALREKMETLDGAAAGSTAAKTYSRIEANSELGGARVVESVDLVNTATVSADITEINSDLLAYTTKTSFGASPVANLDGSPLGEQR